MLPLSHGRIRKKLTIHNSTKKIKYYFTIHNLIINDFIFFPQIFISFSLPTSLDAVRPHSSALTALTQSLEEEEEEDNVEEERRRRTKKKWVFTSG